MKFYISRKITNLCVHCGFCETQIECPGSENCTGCGVCVDACPNQAKILEEVLEERKKVKIKVDGETYEVPEKITILKALEILGYKISYFPTKDGIYAPCRTGGCWACMVLVDGKPKQACITPVKNGMNIQTSKTELEKIQPLRIVSGFQGHPVGGVGTPYWLKPKGFFARYIEVACFAHGCILRCPTCQNWEITYSSKNTPLTPNQAAVKITGLRRLYGVDRMAISGGESTLNYRWLIAYLKNLKKLNPDKDARFHVDTNAVILTKEYIDRLVEAGMTDIGPDIKALTLPTFKKITGIKSEELAKKLLETEWEAVKYLINQYWGKIFIGIGIPYNKKLISLEEIWEIGRKIAEWEPTIQVCVLDYRPEFRRQDIERPSFHEMVKVKNILEDAGLKCVICQTTQGHIGP
ncbi:radical SAM protein [Candidatus Bathyarchaeota archaeon]|nr:MAG: radical SAM protein [Candidatus Bathyarchaeota archaeon]